MTPPTNPSPGSDSDLIADRQLREIASGIPPANLLHPLDTRVLGKVRRRRIMQRTMVGCLAVASLATLLLITSQRMRDDGARLSQLETTTQDVRQPLSVFDSDVLTSPAPAASLDLIDRDQVAILDSLSALSVKDQ